ncbi:hypothetical protein HW44_01760 [Nitrosococcus oceani]|nr:hypothetical protein HW44_01760 [Nitrosococcus oceani]
MVLTQHYHGFPGYPILAGKNRGWLVGFFEKNTLIRKIKDWIEATRSWLGNGEDKIGCVVTNPAAILPANVTSSPAITPQPGPTLCESSAA